MTGIVIIRSDLTVYSGDKNGEFPCYEDTKHRSRATKFNSFEEAQATMMKITTRLYKHIIMVIPE